MRLNSTLVGYVIVVVGLALGLFCYTSSQDAKFRSGLIRTCERVNVLRAQSNVSDMAVWRNFASAIRREMDLAEGKNKPEVHRRSAEELIANAKDITVTALTDCKRATDDPDGYDTILASPIGNPITGHIYPNSMRIERASKALASRVRN